MSYGPVDVEQQCQTRCCFEFVQKVEVIHTYNKMIPEQNEAGDQKSGGECHFFSD